MKQTIEMASDLTSTIEKLNSVFGEDDFSNFFKIDHLRLGFDDDTTQYVLVTNTLDSTSKGIIEGLGYEVTAVNDILDTRRIVFREMKN